MVGPPRTMTLTQNRVGLIEPAALFWGHEKSFDWTRELIFERPKQHLRPSINVANNSRVSPNYFDPSKRKNLHTDLAVAADTSDLVVALVVVVHPPAPHKPSILLSASTRH